MATDDDDKQSPELQLRLFVSGATYRSLNAVSRLRSILEAALPGGYCLDIVDIYRDPKAARDNQVFAVPTLLKLAPIPKRLFVGDLSDVAPLFEGLGLPIPIAAETGRSGW